MTPLDVVSRDDWLAARERLLEREKELTRARDALNEERRRIGMVEVEKDYRFQGPEGEVGLVELFDGLEQLVIQHFMFKPQWEDGCPSCSWSADEVSDGQLRHLREAGTAFALVSVAPFAKLDDYRRRRGWNLRWYSSEGSDFNRDFQVSIDDESPDAVYNYRTRAEHEARGTGYYFEGDLPHEEPGLSFFHRDGNIVFHNYSTYARGTESIGGSHYILDLTALGRQV